MSADQRIYRQKIKATETLEKTFHAMEMIAASRIAAARRRASEADPYTRALTRAMAAVALHSEADHPLTRPRTDTKRVAVLAIAADRGLAGAYSNTILRETTQLIDELKAEGKEPVLFTSGRRARQYFEFRNVPIERAWEGDSDKPSPEVSYEIGDLLLSYFLNPDPEVGVAAVELVFTRFYSMVKMVPEIRQMLPLTIVDAPKDDEDEGGPELGFGPDGEGLPEYEFIPDVKELLDHLLPLYVTNRIANAMLQAAASELASRQQAMHTATENAQEIIRDYERLANQARQAEITQEISEIVSGADALTASD